MLEPGTSLRRATLDDAARIAEIHCESWRRHYRGALSDRYLDSDLLADRLSLWTRRLAEDGGHVTFVAEEQSSVVGFAHVALDADPRWGALVDNLHVVARLQRRGVGTVLLTEAAREAVARRPSSRLFLWVQEQNRSAQAFYRARHGSLGDKEPVAAPNGDPRNLEGTPFKIRVCWPDPTVLIPPT